MGNKYPLVELNELVTIHDNRRKPITKSKRKAGKYPYYGASGIADYIDNYEFDGLYVLLAEDGDNLRTKNTPIAFLASGKFWVNNHAHVLQGMDDLDTQYLCYALRYADVDSFISGSTRPKITQADLKKIKLKAPELRVRRNIASFIKSFDEKIHLNQQTNQTLEQMAQALFKSWFVDFDPVIDNALAAGNEIPDALQHRVEIRKKAHALQKQNSNIQPLPAATQRLFPSEFEHCGNNTLGIQGWIPKWWEVSSIHDLVDTVSQTYKLKEVEEVIFLNTGDIEDGRFLHNNYSAAIGLPGQAKKSIAKGDILYSEIRPKNRRFALVNFDSKDYVVSTKLMVLRAKEDIDPLLPYFILTQETTIHNLQHVAEHRSGTFPQITFKELSDVTATLPKDQTLIDYFVSDYLKPFYDKQYSSIVQNEQLEKLRDTLLPKLISGEVALNKDVT